MNCDEITMGLLSVTMNLESYETSMARTPFSCGEKIVATGVQVILSQTASKDFGPESAVTMYLLSLLIVQHVRGWQ